MWLYFLLFFRESQCQQSSVWILGWRFLLWFFCDFPGMETQQELRRGFVLFVLVTIPVVVVVVVVVVVLPAMTCFAHRLKSVQNGESKHALCLFLFFLDRKLLACTTIYQMKQFFISNFVVIVVPIHGHQGIHPRFRKQ